MKSESSQVLYSNADLLLSLAVEEMKRSSDDVVTYLVCRNARQSIINYLQGYLMDKNVKPAKPITIAGLLEQCKVLDPRFGTLDFSPIECQYETGDKDFCLDLDKVATCFRLAQLTGAWVRE